MLGSASRHRLSSGARPVRTVDRRSWPRDASSAIFDGKRWNAMHRSIAPETRDVAPGSVLLSTVVGVTLAAGGFAIGIGTTGIAEGSTSFWYLSRASGFVAYVLLWGSVMWGLLLSTGTGRRWMRPPQLLDAHQFLSTAAVGFASFHGLVLMGDRYVSFPLRADCRAVRRQLRTAAGGVRADRPLAVGAAHRQLPCPSSYRRAGVEAIALRQLRRVLAGVRPRTGAGQRERDRCGPASCTWERRPL